MGSGLSKQQKQLVCPDDYDTDKFKQILMLYDRLDANGDHVVETEELDKIADLHVRNKIRNYKIFIDRVTKETEDKFSELEKEAAVKICSINTDLMINISKVKTKKSDDVMCANRQIDKLQNMSKEDKSKKFRDAVCDNKGHIQFWTFFDYMKNKTQDIQNIMW